MNFQTKEQFFEQMNSLYEKKIPFFFLTDYLGQKLEIVTLNQLEKENILISSPLFSNYSDKIDENDSFSWIKHPISKENYEKQFKNVQKSIKKGETYLLNLTCSIPIETNKNLMQLFEIGKSKYKLFYKDVFTHFSPEPFIKIEENRIYSFPMKGTMDASVDDAESLLLSNEKELSEQYTIVDLIRNDLSQVADEVTVDDFRYIDKITTNVKQILAVSSKISGNIKPDFQCQLGTIFSKLLPAGSITGAPKKRTMELIAEIEQHDRNYYTGVWGIFDGINTDSCVIIRYIEANSNGFVFKAGGGITSKSKMMAEYQEILDKVYIPI